MVIRWAVQITPETFQETSAWMNEGLCSVQTLRFHFVHLCCCTVSVILTPDIVPWNLSTILTTGILLIQSS